MHANLPGLSLHLNQAHDRMTEEGTPFNVKKWPALFLCRTIGLYQNKPDVSGKKHCVCSAFFSLQFRCSFAAVMMRLRRSYEIGACGCRSFLSLHNDCAAVSSLAACGNHNLRSNHPCSAAALSEYSLNTAGSIRSPVCCFAVCARSAFRFVFPKHVVCPKTKQGLAAKNQ